ncbi:MAG: endoglucanase, partial [Streptococcus sp.]
YNLMRTSDALPKQFQSFYEVTKDKKWLSISDKMLSSLETISSQTETGLIPDFIWVDQSGVRNVKPHTISSQFDSTYSYNACRLPYNLTQVTMKRVRESSVSYWISSAQKNIFLIII